MKKFLLTKNKKAQAWGMDLSVGVLIFLSGIIILYLYTINNSPQSLNKLDEFYYEGKLASKLMLNNHEGILSNEKINQTKIEEFYNLDYTGQKKLLGVNHEFYLKINNLLINGTEVDYVGKINDTEIEDSIKITRLTIYNNRPTKFEIFIWK